MSTINYLTRIEFGEGAIGQLPALIDDLGISRPMIASDRGLLATGMVEKIAGLLKADAVIFSDTPANPTEEAINQAYALFQSAGCDGVIGLGGGSSLDLAKAVRLLSSHEPPLAQYAVVEGGLSRIKPGMCPMIAIPTTSGTGSEVGRAAIVTTADGRKLGILSPHMLPTIALCDPQLTYGLPAALTAATGMDAISHCLETFMASSYNPPADAIAIDGLARGIGTIERAVADPGDVDARRDMMMCALEGAMAFQKGLGAVHALTHALGAVKSLNLHHGTLNAVLMPAVLRFNRGEIGEKWSRLVDLLGGDPDVAISQLNARLDMPSGLGVMGVTEAMLEVVSQNAMKDHCHLTNPRTATQQDYIDLLEQAM
ncbi:iron-containing alcohol dehydrogenase [Pelagibacterium montanilacus]|uniref:iron-containing alcohol dehydrogenase n=1 Tax=Pelagibacterium montanilacus TaxID=2185280 RepID=UPI000F8F6E3C|nr:iron-containing alcohol dehydrogenase [Pelagibacterium montanilacus]